MPVRAITFDFWGTLYHDELRSSAQRRDRRVRQIQSFFGARNVPLTTLGVREALIGLEKQAIDTVRARGASLTRQQIGRGLAERLVQDVDDEGVETLGSVVALAVVHHPPRLADGALDVLETLEAKFRMAVICNTRLSTGEGLRQVMGNDLVLDYFETQTFSDETQCVPQNGLNRTKNFPDSSSTRPTSRWPPRPGSRPTLRSRARQLPGGAYLDPAGGRRAALAGTHRGRCRGRPRRARRQPPARPAGGRCQRAAPAAFHRPISQAFALPSKSKPSVLNQSRSC